MVEITSASSMNDLIEALNANIEACQQIYYTYQKAAELDLEFKSLKEEEKLIRTYIALRLNNNG